MDELIIRSLEIIIKHLEAKIDSMEILMAELEVLEEGAQQHAVKVIAENKKLKEALVGKGFKKVVIKPADLDWVNDW